MRPTDRGGCKSLCCCDSPFLSRYRFALAEVRILGGLAAKRAVESWMAYDAYALSPNQIQQMVLSLAMSEAGRGDLECYRMREVVRRHMASRTTCLLAACLQGQNNGKAWEEVTQVLKDIVGRSKLASRDRDEVLSDSFVEVRERALWRYDGRRSLASFIYGVVRNVLRRRRGQTKLTVPLPEGLAEGTEPSEDAEQRELLQKTAEAVLALPGDSRRILIERLVHSRSFQRIADAAGLRRRQQAHREYRKALSYLRRMLGV